MKEDNSKKVILDLAGGTGAWSLPYKEAGYKVIIIDKVQSDGFMGPVYGDVALFKKLPINIHGILAAPPCTMFCRAGYRWKRTEEQYKEALRIVDACLRMVCIYNPKWWCLENPQGKLKKWIGDPVMMFQPYEYGDPYTKRTCLWGNFNIPEKNPVKPIKAHSGHHAIDAYLKKKGRKLGKQRSALRSITPQGFANAFFKANP